MLPHQIELLSPARDADIGIEAIHHGADAVYIGGPSFGARTAADNSVQDIARLVRHAHRFGSRIFVTMNTILRDDELEPARQLAWQLFDAGVDALIIQDMGLLELDLPPIQLHASTQTDIRDASKARFLQDVGFSQIVLARELSLADVRKIASAWSSAMRPASVNTSPRPRRSKRSWPRTASNALICVDKADCDRFSRRAAPVRVPSVATARNRRR